MKCRLLYLVGQLRAGGLERQLYYLLQSMDRESYQPAVAVWHFCESDPYVARLRALGVPLHPFAPSLSIPAKLSAFRRLVARLNPEAVHSYSFYTNFAAHWGTLGLRAVQVLSLIHI